MAKLGRVNLVGRRPQTGLSHPTSNAACDRWGYWQRAELGHGEM